MKYFFAGLILVSGMLAGCAAPMDDTVGPLNDIVPPYVVVLDYDATADKLVFLSEPQGWEKENKQSGWVGFAPGTYGSIIFTMNEKPGNPVCTSGPNSPGWVIIKIELTKNGNPSTQKGNNFGTSQNGWIARAFPQMNPADGVLRGIDPQKPTISYTLEDLNNDNSARTAYYRITAKRCSDGYTLVTDPGIRNGGR